MTFEEAGQAAKENLYSIYEENEADNIAELLLAHVTQLNRAARLRQKDSMLTGAQQELFTNCLNRLLLYEPVQYVLQEAWFCGHRFLVNSHVLIPRPETEELAYWIKTSAKPGARILDIGTGSGCIAIALKKYLPDADVSAIDISPEALEVAQTNAEDLKTEIHFKLTDILDSNQWDFSNENFDIIVSNPPYIKETEKQQMRDNVLLFEPFTALFVQDKDPLIFYRHIILFAKKYLKLHGRLYFEINEALGKEVVALLMKEGFEEIVLKKDMQGKDRMVSAGLKSNY